MLSVEAIQRLYDLTRSGSAEQLSAFIHEFKQLSPENQAEISYFFNRRDYDNGMTALSWAIANGKNELVDALLYDLHADIYARNADDSTAIDTAYDKKDQFAFCVLADMDYESGLLRTDHDPTTTDHKELLIALAQNDPAVAEMTLRDDEHLYNDNGWDVITFARYADQVLGQPNSRSDIFNKLLRHAISANNYNVCKLLLTEGFTTTFNPTQAVTAVFQSRLTFQLCQAVENNDFEYADALIASGLVNINQPQEYNQNTPLHLVTSVGMLDLLLKNGAQASIHALNQHNETPLDRLLKKHLGPNTQEITPQISIMIKIMLLYGADPNRAIKNDRIRALLNHIVYHPNTSNLIEFALRHGADVNAIDDLQLPGQESSVLMNIASMMGEFGFPDLNENFDLILKHSNKNTITKTKDFVIFKINNMLRSKLFAERLYFSGQTLGKLYRHGEDLPTLSDQRPDTRHKMEYSILLADLGAGLTLGPVHDAKLAESYAETLDNFTHPLLAIGVQMLGPEGTSAVTHTTPGFRNAILTMKEFEAAIVAGRITPDRLASIRDNCLALLQRGGYQHGPEQKDPLSSSQEKILEQIYLCAYRHTLAPEAARTPSQQTQKPASLTTQALATVEQKLADGSLSYVDAYNTLPRELLYQLPITRQNLAELIYSGNEDAVREILAAINRGDIAKGYPIPLWDVNFRDDSSLLIMAARHGMQSLLDDARLLGMDLTRLYHQDNSTSYCALDALAVATCNTVLLDTRFTNERDHLRAAFYATPNPDTATWLFEHDPNIFANDADRIIPIFQQAVAANHTQSIQLFAKFIPVNVVNAEFTRALENHELTKVTSILPLIQHDYLAKMVATAVDSGDVGSLKILEAAGVNVRALIVDGDKQLMQASSAGSSLKINTLLEMGTKPDVTHPHQHARYALLQAAASNHMDAVRTLLDSGANVNARDINGMTALMFAAQHGQAAMVELLIRRGADVNAVDARGNSALSYATFQHNRSIQYQLVEAGASDKVINKAGHGLQVIADVNSPDRSGISPVTKASHRGDDQTVREYFRQSAIVNCVLAKTPFRSSDDNPLMLALNVTIAKSIGHDMKVSHNTPGFKNAIFNAAELKAAIENHQVAESLIQRWLEQIQQYQANAPKHHAQLQRELAAVLEVLQTVKPSASAQAYPATSEVYANPLPTAKAPKLRK